MDDPVMLLLGGISGLFLGAVYFAGLWWTVRKGLSSPRPALWFMGSLLLRTGIVLAGFYLVAGGRWQRLASCLFGFVLARWVVSRTIRTRVEPRALAGKEVHNAS